MQAELPQIGEEWECKRLHVVVTDILETKSKSTNTTSYIIVITHGIVKAFIDLDTFLFSFKKVEENLEKVMKEFNLDQEKSRLERLFSKNS